MCERASEEEKRKESPPPRHWKQQQHSPGWHNAGLFSLERMRWFWTARHAGAVREGKRARHECVLRERQLRRARAYSWEKRDREVPTFCISSQWDGSGPPKAPCRTAVSSALAFFSGPWLLPGTPPHVRALYVSVWVPDLLGCFSGMRWWTKKGTPCV